MSVDAFGLKRENIILTSRVRDIFTPHSPIQSQDFFSGRQKEVNKLIEHINTPGQHALLFGDRGVGKSSIGIITSLIYLHFLGGEKGKHFLKRCDSNDNFATIIAEPLRDCGYDIQVIQTEKNHNEGGEATASYGFFGAKINSSRGKKEIKQGSGINALSPSWVAGIIGKTKALFIIDEADAIKEEADRQKLAELIKQLSDLRSRFKIMVIGIAETGESLTAGHPSVQRCLKETYLKKMDNSELREIVTNGASKLKLVFDYDVISKIVDLSSGYPHFTHLLALKCAEDAIVESRSNIKLAHLKKALKSASEDAEETLKRKYETAIRSTNKEVFKKIISVAAPLIGPDFTIKELREKYSLLVGESCDTKKFFKYFEKLVSDDRSRIFTRTAKGVYRFSDPRMPSYVRILENNIS